jgi:hypothetical protein
MAMAGLAALAFGMSSDRVRSEDDETPVARVYAHAPAAPRSQTPEAAAGKSAGCVTCHDPVDSTTMHASPAVVLGCADCHGGDASAALPAGVAMTDPAYAAMRDRAHVLPRYPITWGHSGSANPVRGYTLLNREAPEFIRFVNPGDYRVARQACGACHMPLIEANERSLMATGAMFFGGASYNNGILPFKRYIIGEAYTPDGEPARLLSAGDPPGTVTEAEAARGALPTLYPIPTWQVTPPGDVFRVFERGGRNLGNVFAEIGLPNPTGLIQRLEEPGRPDIRQSNRGPGTGLRIAVPVLNIHKTRLNDPYTWFMGTNDQPGDYRTSGCSSCHVVYANDREPRHSLGYQQHGRDGETATVDPTIPRDQPGHPIRHAFTRAIPTAQCMTCHMHQPNMFLNSYLGYTMWDYESDAPAMWPEQQVYPTAEEVRAVNDRNPEGAAPRGRWADIDFMREVYGLNPELRDTQFADYHGHGWNFRGVFKRDRAGNLLDAEGAIIDPDDPERWRRAGEPEFVQPGVNPGRTVHMMDIHAEKGLQCADCHFSQDSHGSGLIYGEVAAAVEISCKDCHGTARALPTLRTSGPAAPPEGTDLALIRNPDGQRRFEWLEREGRRVLVQRSIVDPALEWEVSLVRDTVDPENGRYNPRAARAKLMSRAVDGRPDQAWGPGVAQDDLAHDDEDLACFTCHTSWTPSCGGCHLPVESNWQAGSHRAEGGTTRSYATYNPQVAREDMFQLGRHQTSRGSVIAPVRSSSALVLSSTNINRERIYAQQPPVSAPGFSSQAFAPHFPHTVRTTETKTCTDCHVSEAEDNNAIMAQLLLLGTNTVNFVGLHAWVGLERGLEAVRVTEWDEPQAVFGSYLHRYAYPDYWQMHVERNGRELIDWTRGQTFDASGSGETRALEEISNTFQSTGGAARCLQLRGEYLYVAEGAGGFRVYDVASIANKGVSDRILTAPVSPLGQATRVRTANATCMALPTNQPIAPTRNTAQMREENLEQAFHPIYHYAVITDAREGLVLVDVDTLADGDPRNNNLSRAVTWNAGGVLNGARHVTLAGHYAYVAADAGLVIVDLDDPRNPRHVRTVPLTDVRASALQFRYLFVTDADGVRVLDATDMTDPRPIEGAVVPLADARKLYAARTYLYVAAKREGLIVINIERPRSPRILTRVTLDGTLNDAEDVIVGATNASLFAYVADGVNGMKVLQLTSPASQRNFYGFSPEPRPELIAFARTASPALALSKGLDRDRAVDETGHQMAVFGRLGSRPFNRIEMERLFMTGRGTLYRVSDALRLEDWWPGPTSAEQPN